MNIKIILLFTLILSCALSYKVSRVNRIRLAKIQEIKATKTWGSILMQLAELNLKAKGPLDMLIEAIQESVNDLTAKGTANDKEYQKRTASFQKESRRLNGEIDDNQAEIDKIQKNQKLLKNQEKDLKTDKGIYEAKIAELQKLMKSSAAIRTMNHKRYKQEVAEMLEGQKAIRQCITILENTQKETKYPGQSLLQMQKARTALSLVQTSLRNNRRVETSYIHSYIRLATEVQYSDKSALANIIEKFQEMLQNSMKASVALAQKEQAAAKVYNKQLNKRTLAVLLLKKQIKQAIADLLENREMQEELSNLAVSRIKDKKEDEAELKDENEKYDKFVKQYQKFKQENDREVKVLKKALDVIGAADFAGIKI